MQNYMHNHFGSFFYAYPNMRRLRYPDNKIRQRYVLLLRFLEYGEYIHLNSFLVTFMFLKSRAFFEFRKPWHLQIQFSEKIESDRNLL